MVLACLISFTLSGCTQMAPLTGFKDEIMPTFGRRPTSASPAAAAAAPAPRQGSGSGLQLAVRDSTISSSAALLRSVNLKSDMVPRGRHGRKVVRPMTPRFITIHSTQNYSANAWRHSAALKNGALRATKRRGGNRIGYLIWHFTVDDKVAVQHMPTSEQGEHADFDGPGNRYSIGIEMCEHRGSNRAATLERTARLTAYLMHRHGIPLQRVVPHYHWPRRGCSPAHKNCPHFLLDNGRPGRKWRGFLAKVNYYHRGLVLQSVASR
jgi:N-acetylmuramoyl-L-alanine amidase